MKNRKGILVLALLLAAAFVFAGGEKEATGSSVAPQTGAGTEPLTFPIVQQPLELTTFVNFDPTKAGGALKSYADMACYKEMEKLTNIKMTFIHPPVGQEREQLNLMVSAGQFPDIIEWGWLNYPGGPEKAIQDKVIIPTNDVIERWAPNLKRVLEENPDARKQVMTDNGTTFGFPFLRLSDSWRVILGFQAREAWLTKAGLAAPQTIDDWHAMLTHFKRNDMNGNGDPNDELPYVSRGLPRLIPLTGAWGISYSFYREGNTVKFGPAQPAFKDFLTTMNRWYKEGLIDPDFMSMDQKQFDAAVSGDLAGVWHGLLSGDLGRLTQLTRKNNPEFAIQGLPFPVGPAGKPYDTEPQRVMIFPGTTAGISTSNKHVRETAKYLDYAYSPEGHRLMVFGIEGESYNMVNGEPVYTDLILKNPTLSVDQAIGVYARGTGSPPGLFTTPHFKGRIFLPDQHRAQAAWATGITDIIMPPVASTPEEGRRLASLLSNINTFVDEMTAKFITGREPLENFDKYLATLKQLNVDEAVAMRQSSLERYNNRK